MRRLCLVALLIPVLVGLVGCTGPTATRVDARTFQIEGPPVPGGAEGPNRRMAAQLCPKGYRVLEAQSHNTEAAMGQVTTWTVRCL